jgi:hypothetical protein
VNSDVALANLSSCRTVLIVAKYSLRVHWLASLSDLSVRLSLPMDSVFVNWHPDHGLMGCYLFALSNRNTLLLRKIKVSN